MIRYNARKCNALCVTEVDMAANKTEFLNMRVMPATKRALRAIAARENRSMANALEWLVAEYMARNQIPMSRPTPRRVRAHAG